MRVKHFMGYGSVEVKKVQKLQITNEYGEKKTKLVLRVEGNHEWGLFRDDISDVRRWIFNKFEKNFKGDDYDIDMEIQTGFVEKDGVNVEEAIYSFVY